MRIAFDHQIFTRQTYGGVSRYFVRLAENLLKAGEAIRVFAPLHLNSHLVELPGSIVQGIKLRPFAMNAARLVELYNHLVASRLMANWQPDVIHETYYTVTSRPKPKTYATVVTVYDMIHELFPNGFSIRDRTSQLKRQAVERADHVICISESTRRDLLRLFGTADRKVSVVHLGYSTLSPKSLPVSAEKNGRGRPFVLYVGNRGGYKNFKGLLEAMSASPSLMRDLDLIAFGRQSFTSDELALIRNLGFKQQQVRHVTGNDDVLSALYHQAKVFVYPSLYEGFGLAALEAMAHRCPVVSSNTGSMPEVIGDAGEYFDPVYTQSMVDAIERVVYSDDRARALIERGAERVQYFSWQRCADQTRAAYRRL